MTLVALKVDPQVPPSATVPAKGSLLLSVRPPELSEILTSDPTEESIDIV